MTTPSTPKKASALLRKVSAVTATAAILYGFTPRSAFAVASWDGGAGTNIWSDSDNWSADAVPNNSGAVTIDTGASVLLNSNANVNSSLTLSNNSSLEVTTGGTLDLGSSGDPTINAGSVLTVSGGTVKYRRWGILRGTLNITGGQMISATNDSSGAMKLVNLSGGTYTIQSTNLNLGFHGSTSSESTVNISGSGVMTAKTVNMGEASAGYTSDLNLSGGSFTATKINQANGKITVSGGSFSTTNNYSWVGLRAPATQVFEVKGGAGTIDIGGNFATTGNAGIRSFVMTAQNSGLTQENISKINVAGTDSAGGDVDVSLEGGILLAHPTEYTLISAGTLSATPNYTGTDLYTGAADGNDYKITLDSSLTQGDLTLTAESAPVSESFDLTGVGYLNTDLSAILGANTSLRVRLDVGTGTGSMEDLLTYLSNSGYSDFALESVGDYDIAFTVSNDYLSDGMMYFGWDLTDFANGAGLMGVEVTAVPEPNAIWLLSAAGLSLLLWRRRGSLLAGRAA